MSKEGRKEARKQASKQASKYIPPSKINLIFITYKTYTNTNITYIIMYTNINSLKLKIVVIAVRCNGRDSTKKLCNFIFIVVP